MFFLNNLLIIIIFIAILLFIYNMNKPKVQETISILDDIHPSVINQVNNGKLNIWTFVKMKIIILK